MRSCLMRIHFITHTWSFRRRRTKGVIIFLARDTRSCARSVILESPFVLKTARSESIPSANCSGRMKFIKDWTPENWFSMSKRALNLLHITTHHKLLKVVLQRSASQEKSPFGFIPKEGLISLGLKVLQNMPFIEYTCLDPRLWITRICARNMISLTSQFILLKNFLSFSSPCARL